MASRGESESTEAEIPAWMYRADFAMHYDSLLRGLPVTANFIHHIVLTLPTMWSLGFLF